MNFGQGKRLKILFETDECRRKTNGRQHDVYRAEKQSIKKNRTILAVGFAFLVSLVCNYDHYVDLSTRYYEEYSNYEATYGESLSASFGLPFDEALEHLLKSDYA